MPHNAGRHNVWLLEVGSKQSQGQWVATRVYSRWVWVANHAEMMDKEPIFFRLRIIHAGNDAISKILPVLLQIDYVGI